MLETKAESKLRVTEVIERYGKALGIDSMDPHFKDITVGIYRKGQALTFGPSVKSQESGGASDRSATSWVNLGGLVAIENTHDQARFPCATLHARPLRFLLAQAVEKDPDYTHPSGPLSIQDTKTESDPDRRSKGTGRSMGLSDLGRGDPEKIPLRLPAVQAGFLRYGEMEKVERTRWPFPAEAATMNC